LQSLPFGELGAAAGVGRGVVVGLTVNYRPWVKGVEVPYLVALVELEEQSDLCLMTNMPRTACRRRG